MDLFVIGKYCNEKGHSEAYKIYNRKTKKSMLMSKNDIRNLIVKSGVQIGGLFAITRDYCTEKGVVTVGLNVKKRMGMYNMSKLEEVDGKGCVKSKPNMYVLTGYYRFGADRLYECVDAEGKEHMLDHAAFMLKLQKSEIIGATIRNNKLSIYKDSKNQLYN